MTQLILDDRPRAQFPTKLKPMFFTPAPLKVAWGGRGSAKSRSFSQGLTILAASTNIRVLCAREIQKSIKDSVHQVICDQITRLRLQSHFQILDTEIRAKRTGSIFLFSGLRTNAAEIKSKEGLNIAWIEEAEKVSKSSWEYLEPTLRAEWVLPFQFWPKGTIFTDEERYMGGRLVDPEIWVSFNPDEEKDYIYQKFIGGDPPKPDWRSPSGALIVEINWRDNPWFPKNLMRQKDDLMALDHDAYLHVWEGKCRKQSAAQILRGKYTVEHFEVDPSWSGPYNGTDWGFATDPTASVRCWIDEDNRRLMIEYEAFEYHTETDDLPTLLNTIPDHEKYVNRADCARPETISYCRRHGHPRMVGVEKWAGSVEDGIMYLRQEFVQIVIHPRCVNTADEAKLWSYKIDKNSQDVLPEVEDKNNHCWDAVRYSIAPIIKGRVKFKGKWWKRWVERATIEAMVTLKMVVVTVDDTTDGAAELSAVFQCWGVIGTGGMALLDEAGAYGDLPEILEATTKFWNGLRGAGSKDPNELWADAKSVGDTFLRTLRSRGIPAREWAPEDKSVLDRDYRAKQASIPLSEGRVMIPSSGCSVSSEVEGLATDAMSLALLVWKQRGGGSGPIPPEV
ncbi:MAG: hypothetical protein A2Y38_12390 [Spirochaetes bacterium GWB1_59_5]|nr:MAG: hypothetical protein A2Y38_12390 [Spirochaetes bacterium GWB1_59_5]